MADTTSSPNNNLVAYRGRPQRERKRPMPVVSKAQNRAMHAAAAGKSTLGIPPKVGAEMTAPMEPGSVKVLPEKVAASPRVAKMRKRGLISNSRFGQDKEQDVDASSR